jgi:hypothetical protein
MTHTAMPEVRVRRVGLNPPKKTAQAVALLSRSQAVLALTCTRIIASCVAVVEASCIRHPRGVLPLTFASNFAVNYSNLFISVQSRRLQRMAGFLLDL